MAALNEAFRSFVGEEFERIPEMIKSLGRLLRVKNKLECVRWPDIDGMKSYMVET